MADMIALIAKVMSKFDDRKPVVEEKKQSVVPQQRTCGGETHIFDWDGSCIPHTETCLSDMILASRSDIQPLPGIKEKFNELAQQGHTIIILTARPESSREVTHDQITRAGLFYDYLIMGVGTGVRYIYNDTKPAKGEHSEPLITAVAVPLERNKGLV